MSGFTIDFRDAKTRAHLARMLSTSEDMLTYLIGSSEKAFLVKHSIPKRNRSRGTRVVYEVRDEDVGIIYKTLLSTFQAFAAKNIAGYPGDHSHAYIPKRSIVTNAWEHRAAPVVLNADLRSFFPSITSARLTAELIATARLAPTVAADIAQLVTVGGGLALGLPPSPLFANIICLELDRKLAALAAQTGSKYTRYADDLTFSGKVVPSRHQLASVVVSEGFELAEGKFSVRKRGQATYVTGLSVADRARPRVPKAFKHALRQELYYCEKHGIRAHIERRGYGTLQSGLNYIDGSIKFVRGVERALGIQMHSQWSALLARDGLVPTYASRLERLGQQVTLFVDEATLSSPDGDALALICVAVEDADGIRERFASARDALLADPFSLARKRVLKQKGLHFSEISADARQTAFDLIARTPCRAYVAIAPLSGSYQDAYLSLLELLLTRRFVALDRRPVDLVCEQNSKVPRPALEELVRTIYGRSRKDGGRRPLSEPTLSVAGKEDAGLWLADGLLWALSVYTVAKDDDREVRLIEARFELLRPKYRVIHDGVRNRLCTRRRPFTRWALG